MADAFFIISNINRPIEILSPGLHHFSFFPDPHIHRQPTDPANRTDQNLGQIHISRVDMLKTTYNGNQLGEQKMVHFLIVELQSSAEIFIKTSAPVGFQGIYIHTQ
jgi:hypothetical protein